MNMTSWPQRRRRSCRTPSRQRPRRQPSLRRSDHPPRRRTILHTSLHQSQVKRHRGRTTSIACGPRIGSPAAERSTHMSELVLEQKLAAKRMQPKQPVPCALATRAWKHGSKSLLELFRRQHASGSARLSQTPTARAANMIARRRHVESRRNAASPSLCLLQGCMPLCAVRSQPSRNKGGCK